MPNVYIFQRVHWDILIFLQVTRNTTISALQQSFHFFFEFLNWDNIEDAASAMDTWKVHENGWMKMQYYWLWMTEMRGMKWQHKYVNLNLITITNCAQFCYSQAPISYNQIVFHTHTPPHTMLWSEQSSSFGLVVNMCSVTKNKTIRMTGL